MTRMERSGSFPDCATRRRRLSRNSSVVPMRHNTYFRKTGHGAGAGIWILAKKICNIKKVPKGTRKEVNG